MIHASSFHEGNQTWGLFDEEDPVAAGNTLQRELAAAFKREGVPFGSFTIVWLPREANSKRDRILLKRTGKKVHLSSDSYNPSREATINNLVASAREHLDSQDAIGRYVASVWHNLRHLLPYLSERPLMANHVGGNRTYMAYAHLLSDGLAETLVPIRLGLGGRHVEEGLTPVVEQQRLRRAKIEAAGSRGNALTCCPVAAAVVSGSHKRRDKVVANMKRALADGATTIKDGHYAPSVALGKGISWKDGRMSLPLDLVPSAIRSILDGRTIGEIIEHPWLPEGTITSHAERGNDLEIRIAFDPVPLMPVARSIGMTLDQII